MQLQLLQPCQAAHRLSRRTEATCSTRLANSSVCSPLHTPQHNGRPDTRINSLAVETARSVPCAAQLTLHVPRQLSYCRSGLSPQMASCGAEHTAIIKSGLATSPPEVTSTGVTWASAFSIPDRTCNKQHLQCKFHAYNLNDVHRQAMFVGELDGDGTWRGALQPYGPIQLYPSSQVLNYGQSVFEGMKAQRSEQGRIVLFRPDRNAARMQEGAARLSMAAPPADFFIDAVKQTVQANQDMVPPVGQGSLYLRPLLLGTGPILGLGPAPAYQFYVYCAAVGAYFKGGQLTPIDLIVESKFHRAAPGGMGGTKCAGNYSPVLLVQLAAKQSGYADVVYLDAKTDTYLEEVSSCNIFVVKGNTIKTPPLQGTILPGVTRRSIIELAQARGYTVEEVPVTAAEAMEADEVFTTGTAVVVSPVGSLTYEGKRRQFGEPGQSGPVALELYDALTGIQTEKSEDKFGWVCPV